MLFGGLAAGREHGYGGGEQQDCIDRFHAHGFLPV
jgi:hypothetical protein